MTTYDVLIVDDEEELARSTVDYLAAHDRQTLAALTAHQEAGQRFGCWK